MRGGYWITAIVGKKLAITTCLLNVALLVSNGVLLLWRLLRRLVVQAVVRLYWQVAVGHLGGSLFWGWLWWYTASNQPHKIGG